MVEVTSSPSEEISFVPHSAQKEAVSGFSDWHLGHLIPIAVPLFSHVWSAKGYQGIDMTVKHTRDHPPCLLLNGLFVV